MSGVYDYAGPTRDSRYPPRAVLPSAQSDSVGVLIGRFRSSIPSPPIPLFTLRCAPRGAQRKTRGRVDRYSFLVRIFILCFLPVYTGAPGPPPLRSAALPFDDAQWAGAVRFGFLDRRGYSPGQSSIHSVALVPLHSRRNVSARKWRSASRNSLRRLSNRTVTKKNRSERKGRRSRDTALRIRRRTRNEQISLTIRQASPADFLFFGAQVAGGPRRFGFFASRFQSVSRPSSPSI